MSAVLQKIDSIELKVRQMALKLERLKNENAALQDENNKLKTALEQKEEEIVELGSLLKFSQEKLSKTLEKNDEQKLESLKQQIDQYIIDIDRCIEWLHKN